VIRRTVFAVAIAAAFSAPVLAQNPAQDPPSISTQGQSVFNLSPDVAWVSVTAEARAPKPGDAQRKAADAMTSVQAAIKTVGLAADAFKTSQYSLQPDMEYVNGSSRVKGYIARNTIEVRVDEINKLGAVIDAAGASGAASVSGMRFDVKNRESVEREALAAAAKDGIERARAIAAGLGQTIGAVIRVQDQRLYQPQAQRFMAEAGGGGRALAAPAPTPIEPGDIEIRAIMTVTVAIK
jgi:uncharacterized protein YggE